MKIGVICPIGPLDRFGYQYIYKAILESLTLFADVVYLPSSTKNRTNVDKLLNAHYNIKYVANEETWFGFDSNGREIHKRKKSAARCNYTLDLMKKDGIDCAIVICINQYIPMHSQAPLRSVCEDLISSKKPFEWLYKKYQLGNQLFHSDSKVPFIINLTTDRPCKIASDSIITENGRKIHIKAGDYRRYDHVAIVDAPYEMTIDDLKDKVNFIKNYADLRKDVRPFFVKEEQIKYHVHKCNRKIISNEKLDYFGEKIAANSSSDFIGWEFLKNYSGPPIYKRFYRYMRSKFKK